MEENTTFGCEMLESQEESESWWKGATVLSAQIHSEGAVFFFV